MTLSQILIPLNLLIGLVAYFYSLFVQNAFKRATLLNLLYFICGLMIQTIVSHNHLSQINFIDYILNMGNAAFPFRHYPPLISWTIGINLGQIALIFYSLKTAKKGPELSWQKSVLHFILHLFLIIGIIFPTYQYFNFTQMLTHLTHGMIQFDRFKPYSVRKTFQKNNQSIVLIPMVHIGGEEFYKNVLKEYYQKEGIVLQEGVNDETKRLVHGADYKGVAQALGLSTQKDQFKLPESSKLKLVTADVDTTVFDQETINKLNLIFKFTSDLKGKSEDALSDFLKLQVLMANRESTAAFFEDILIKRNRVLIQNLNQYKENNLILVPWGALHLPEIQSYLIDQGYQLTYEDKVSVLGK